MVSQIQLSKVVQFDCKQWHGSTVDRELLNFVLTDELREILERKLIHFLALEVNHFRNLPTSKCDSFSLKQRMSEDLSQHNRRLQNVLLKPEKICAEINQRGIPVLRCHMKQSANDVAHVIRQYKVIEEVRHLVNVRLWSFVAQTILGNVLCNLWAWRYS